jgi:D-beta-D-heptose 7-phosphate kinase/D-beta-D-heptose 1-phosphate adenosyltransferase
MSITNKLYNETISYLSIIADWKEKQEKIVFTNGCFDIIHIGHVVYLEQAKTLGTKLIVGINNDESVSALKGPHRPINTLQNRMTVLAALESVDMVIPFEEETPYQLIKNIIPDVLVKGGDWKTDQIIGSDIVLGNGGEVRSLSFVVGISTTTIEAKIKGENRG